MKIWFRVHGYSECSWTYVWDHLRDAFATEGDEIALFDAPEDIEDYVEMWWGDPQYWEWHDGAEPKLRVAIALSEARSILTQGRKSVIDNLNIADVIVSPSFSARTAFQEAPIDVPITVVPFGVDASKHPYIERDWGKTLKFVHAGATQFRKGSWLIPEAFVATFSELDDVELHIVTSDVHHMYSQLKREYGDHPKITFTCKRYKNSLDLYRDYHIYVSPHLSEGFGLCVPEAMATGMPCLVSRCSAPREFFSNQYGWWIEMSEEYVPVADCLPATNGFWRLPSLESLAAKMAEANDNRIECAERGQAGSYYINDELTWRHTAQGIKSVIEEVLNEENIGGDQYLQRGKLVTGPSGKHYATC